MISEYSITNDLIHRYTKWGFIEKLSSKYNVFAFVIPTTRSYLDDIYLSRRIQYDMYEHDRLCLQYGIDPDNVFRGFYCYSANDVKYLFYDIEYYSDQELHDFLQCYSKKFDTYYRDLVRIKSVLMSHADKLNEYIKCNGNHIHIE